MSFANQFHLEINIQNNQLENHTVTTEFYVIYFYIYGNIVEAAVL